MTNSILKTTNLTKTYQNGEESLTVLDNISIAVPAAETAAIIGHSGSGKTTLLGLCAGLDQATSGSIELVNENLSTLNEDARAKLRAQSIGFIFQSFQLMPSLTALENVLIPAELQGTNNASATNRAKELLDRVGLSSRIKHYPTQLSGGEQQRVAIARAFIHNPKILFADEPTGNLDAEASEIVETMLFDLNREAQTALVIVTHDPELAKKANQIFTLKAGKLQ